MSINNVTGVSSITREVLFSFRDLKYIDHFSEIWLTRHNSSVLAKTWVSKLLTYFLQKQRKNNILGKRNVIFV
jgi:hypothetical protein